MADWAPKRFWKAASITEADGGFVVALDARPLRTPQKAALVLPSLAMAEAVAAEWQAQQDVIKPETMPYTRAANSAIDKLTHQLPDVAQMLAAYAETDLLCYRAARPLDLVALQAAHWDPLLDWARETFDADLQVTVGVIPVAQPPASLAALKAEVMALDRFEMAGFHDLVAISGSLVLALAVLRGRLTAEEAWTLSRIDESFQNAQWGVDEEEAETEAIKREAFLQAHRFYQMAR